jgi:hypothetical protein
MLWVLASCGYSQSNNYAAAGAALAMTVAATGVYRATTGGCWANCAKGWYCDRESGLCRRGECDPSCAVGDFCVREADGQFRCVVSTGTFAFSRGAPDAGTAPRAASTDAGSDGAAAKADPADGSSTEDAAPCSDGSSDAGADRVCADARSE